MHKFVQLFNPTQIHPGLGFLHIQHGGRADGFLLALMIALGALAIFMIATMDKSK
ncbi:MAG TPA: hypothetical protein VNU95_01125 [Candidatus Acidoferrales bacterium]|jgi:hypothetical protein|nr:hypothetical protein [Candidatus Acidoferrales bacterium]